MTYITKYNRTLRRACLSALFTVLSALGATAQTGSTKVYRVTADAKDGGDGSSWKSPLTLQTALGKAVAGDEVWVRGYRTISNDSVYHAPTDGFQLRSGVKLYGGLSGNEETSAQAANPAWSTKKYEFAYQTVLLADSKYGNDSIPANYIIYPENPTRKDNARHCLVMNIGVSDDNLNLNNQATVASGLVLAGGNASGAEDSDSGHGGGILVLNRSTHSGDGNAQQRAYNITQCYFVNNYAQRGGAIYVDPAAASDNSRISYCGVYNNASGLRTTNVNLGGGVWLGGGGTLYNSEVFNNNGGGIRLSDRARVVSCTVVHNTVTAVDLVDASSASKVPAQNGGGTLYNTVLWGSSTLSKTETKPAFRNCAYPEVQVDSGSDTDDNKNQYIDWANFSNDPSAWFITPSSNVGYDRSFNTTHNMTPSYNFQVEEQSALIDAGDAAWYRDYASSTPDTDTDLAGNPRYNSGHALDIGAYEREVLPAGRRLYVATDGDDGNDGMSWDKPMRNPQTAIDKLAESKGRGEVWVKTGTYHPTKHMKSNTDGDNTTPLAFQMRDGISVMGGFQGGETMLSERKMGKSGMAWDFAYPTVFQGTNASMGGATWNKTDEVWTLSSDSYHVVWFAPNPYETMAVEFQQTTIIDGVTIEGGKATNSAAGIFQPLKGTGVYMSGSNNLLRRCIVRGNSGVVQGGKDETLGGGIYCEFGQVRYSLVYNNSATKGGGIYMNTVGFINNSMVANNSASQGAGVYFERGEYPGFDNYLILATSIVTNNTSTNNGAVYVDGSALVEQSTIANNFTSNVTDAGSSDANTPYTAGLYVKNKCTAVNNILWNNTLRQSSASASSTKRYSASLANLYATGHTRETALFYNNAISDINAVNWTNIYQSGSYELNTVEFDTNSDKDAQQYAVADSLTTQRGVQGSWTDITYFWRTRKASVLRNLGLLYGQLSEDLLFKPSTDFYENNFQAQPPVGPYISDSPEILFDAYTKPGTLRLYFDETHSNPQGKAYSWEQAYSSLNDLLSFVSTLVPDANVSVVSDASGTEDDAVIDEDTKIEILVREGTITPTLPYTFQENDPHSCCFNVKASDIPVSIIGGYPAYTTMANPTDADRDPAKYRTEFTGNADGTALNEGLYHVFRIETGAHITLDGVAITHGYAAGSAYNPLGGGILVGSLYAVDAETDITLRNCILENNSAHYGPAIAAMNDLRGGKLKLVNCVVNNNQADNQDVIYTNSTSNTIDMQFVSMVNNIGKAPADMGNTSFAAGNVLYKTQADGSHTFNPEGARNTLTLATTGKDGALNFANPTNNVGVAMSGNVYYGGNACFRPLTSSTANNSIINTVADNATVPATDIAGNPRDLGGLPDLGAYEALLPKKGKVIYVRSYNTDWKEADCMDGTPDFNLLNENPGATYDGLTWDRAIQGNAVCDTTKMYGGNEMYVLDGGKMMAATLDNTKYGTDYNARTAPYGQTSNAYGEFFSNTNGNSAEQKRSDGTVYNKITNNRDERYVSGLQIAVEKAARYNAAHRNDADFEEMTVWVGAGVYTDFKGFVIRNGVKVYGGFPKNGNPGENDRRPLLSQYIPARKDYKGLNKADYETVLQVRKETPVYLTNGTREMWWSEGKPSDGSDYDFIQKLVNSGKVERHYVLYQPDVCTTTWNITGKESKQSFTSQDTYRYPGFGTGQWSDKQYYQEYSGVKWDGFSIRHGYLTNYRACRDGGAGVRAFRGTTFENLIIVNNIAHGPRARGGGLYMDGDQSVIFNSFILRNMCFGYAKEGGDGDCYGGGAYMIQGTGYNLVVASNRAKSHGGGIFIESAKFYNNTVCHNMSEAKEGTGIMHWQNADPSLTGIVSSLTLYNCLLYDNMQNGGKTDGVSQVGTSAANMFNRAYNCYVDGKMGSLASKFSKEDGNITLDNYSSVAYPFEVEGNDKRWSSSQRDSIDGGVRFSTARRLADYRLKEKDGLDGNPCLNGGTEDMPTIPATDMDYTDRIKDCTIDIGAYEADNSANIKPQAKTRKKTVTTTTATGGTTTKEVDETYYVYYVTETGYGNRSGSDPENAACAEKLQSVLTAAGQFAYDNDYKYKVYVKVAGYQPDEDGDRFVYHVNTLADPDDPQSYTFLVPQGVWMMGGYYEGTWETVTTGSGTNQVTTRRLTGYNWDNDARDVITSYQTVLSAKTQPKQGSAVGEVTGYHVVSFGKWPKGEIQDYYQHALPGKTVDGKLVNPTAGIDGVRLTDGAATDNAGFNGMGGGAVVPAYAHVRNCVASGCQAVRGGAFAILPGSIVSGSIMHDNKARQGGAVYAANAGQDQDRSAYHAYIASSTICGNTATTGGGIYQEAGAAFVGNTVIWGNNATTGKNISGITDQKFVDRILLHPGADMPDGGYYPYNNCFVERMRLSANTTNTYMESDLETYFASTGEYFPRPYSPLIDNGVPKEYQRYWVTLGVATHDVRGVARGSKDRLTVGAYAITLPTVDDKTLLKRLFVSIDGGAEVSDELKAKYIGRSFYTPFNSLDAALAYITHARTNNIGTEANPKYLASDTTHFEILISGGTYRPSVAREDENNVGSAVVDRRMQSFSIPVNVAIFGSFFSTDQYSSDPVSTTATDTPESFISINNGGKDVPLEPNGSIAKILDDRNKKHREDLNKNGLLEPWEFANPTVFSGDIKASETERKVYHVVYSRISDSKLTSAQKAELNNDVILDGITIVNGETSDGTATDDGAVDGEDVNDEGHGGGIFAYNVNYTLNRCRVLRNKAIHGGGIFVHNASLDIMGCAISCNWAGSETNGTNTGVGRGGAICADFTETKKGNVHAVNSLFANNTAGSTVHMGGSSGGAIFMKVDTLDEKDLSYRNLSLMNCIVVRNKAMMGGDIGYYNNDPKEANKLYAVNTVFWGNESQNQMQNGEYKPTAHMMTRDSQMSHCATDLRGLKEGDDDTRAVSANIILDRDNMAARGPRFKKPSTETGDLGFDISTCWNPASLSILTDAGAGSLKACEDETYDTEFDSALKDPDTTDPYMQWWQMHTKRLLSYGYPKEYVSHVTDSYRRYVGPRNADGTQGVRKIDIGLYEFQYKLKMAERDAVYIGTVDAGKADGSSWDNQSSDLHGAIVAMANPIGNSTQHRDTHRKVFVQGGEYYSPTMTGGDAFQLIVNTDEEMGKFVDAVEIVGACIGEEDKQDFSKPTVIVPNPSVESTSLVGNLLSVTTNGRPVTLSGLSLRNDHKYTGTEKDRGGRGVNVNITNAGGRTDGKLTVRDCSFTGNLGTGLNVSSNESGELLVYNTLFADGAADGLNTRGKTTVVNATFAQNKGMDITAADGGKTEVYNTVAWENCKGQDDYLSFFSGVSESDMETNHNVWFKRGQENDDVLNGPCFTDPSAGDYSIRPNKMLFNRGDNQLYTGKTGVTQEALLGDEKNGKEATERELSNSLRCIGGTVDIGAYECESKLLPIIYVKTGVGSNGSGESWDLATGSLQSAVNMAEIYANTNQASKTAYVFVDREVSTPELSVTLPGVKIYGTMNNEKSDKGGDTNPVDYSLEQINNIVADLLSQRKGTIESAQQSKMGNVTVDYDTDDKSADRSNVPCVVDGFVVNGKADMKQGYLSTSVVEASAQVSGAGTATLYNSLALGKVSDVRAVNVTAVKSDGVEGSGSLPNAGNTAANRAGATVANKYVSDKYWMWQLNDFSVNADGTYDFSTLNADIDANADSTQTVACAKAVGHRRDLAGNLRMRQYGLLAGTDKTQYDQIAGIDRYNYVDNGCFETWYLPVTYTVSKADYPRGKSVIYVRGESRSDNDQTMNPFFELRLDSTVYTSANKFNPGFLLLKHHAGLRGCGSYIDMGNFAVEREFHVDADTKKGWPDLCVMPFSTTKREQYVGGKLQNGVVDLYEGYAYDGLARAAFDYSYDSTNGKAWVKKQLATDSPTEGLMIVPKENFTLRFYAASYKENHTPTTIRITQYNFQEPWSQSYNDGVKFTHKENMGWNLFGSPYLCAMNYSDLGYGRVLYVDNILSGKGYTALNTVGPDGTARDGYIPACDAVFTQTATLSTYEAFAVAHSDDFSGSAYQDARTLKVSLTPANAPASRADDDGSVPSDNLVLNAVESDEARTEFDMSEDGVKWMSSGSAQLYAVNGQSRYSLLSAVNRDGEVRVGVSLPEAGAYIFSVPDDCDRDDYEAVLLKDSQTGKAIDLLESSYQFAVADAGEQNTRFTVSFRKSGNAAGGITVRKVAATRVRVAGLQPDDEVRMYASSGILANQARAASDSITMSTGTQGVIIVEVLRDGKQLCVRKLR